MNYEYNSRVIRVGVSWTDDAGVKYPSNWATRLTEEEKADIGLIKIPTKPSFDSRFFYSYDAPRELEDVLVVDEAGQPVIDPDTGAQLINKGLKSELISNVKETANLLLKETDWMVIRQAEGIKDMSAEVLTYRQAVRDASNQIEAAISVCGTIDDIIMLHTIPTDAEGIPTGNAPINNWPEM